MTDKNEKGRFKTILFGYTHWISSSSSPITRKPNADVAWSAVPPAFSLLHSSSSSSFFTWASDIAVARIRKREKDGMGVHLLAPSLRYGFCFDFGNPSSSHSTHIFSHRLNVDLLKESDRPLWPSLWTLRSATAPLYFLSNVEPMPTYFIQFH